MMSLSQMPQGQNHWDTLNAKSESTVSPIKKLHHGKKLNKLMVPLILVFSTHPTLMMILLLTRLVSTYLKASNSVEARLESKENSESGQSQIYNAGDLQKVIFLSQ